MGVQGSIKRASNSVLMDKLSPLSDVCQMHCSQDGFGARVMNVVVVGSLAAIASATWTQQRVPRGHSKGQPG